MGLAWVGARAKGGGMRPIWKGHISFGLVNIPVTLYPAEQRTDLSFHMLDSRNNARVRYERVNADTGDEVPWDQIVKGYEYDDDRFVIIDSEELKRVAPEATRSVEIEAFVELSDIDLVYFDKPYYLEPGKKGEKGYALLREVLADTGRAGIARVVIRTRQYIAAMVARGDGLVLNLLRYPQELRPMADLELPGSAEELGVSKAELKMARTLVDSMSATWEPEEYHDEYREALVKWIEGRIEAGQIERAPEMEPLDEEAPAPINMMEALKKSLAASAPKKTAKKSKKKTTKKKAG
jgi:DNA end-binding protein Ku